MEIKSLRKGGWSIVSLTKKYNMSKSGMKSVLLTEEQRLSANLVARDWNRKYPKSKEKIKHILRKAYERKKQISGESLEQYRRERNGDNKYYWKNKEKILAKAAINYQLKKYDRSNKKRSGAD